MFHKCSTKSENHVFPLNVLRFPDVLVNGSSADGGGWCSGVLWHQHVHVRSAVTGEVGGVPQREIQALTIRYKVFMYLTGRLRLISKTLSQPMLQRMTLLKKDKKIYF